MRPSEYLALKWSDMDWTRGAVSVCRTIQYSNAGWAFDDTKRKRSRRLVKLQEFVLEALRVARSSQARAEVGRADWTDLIFCKEHGPPLRQRAVKKEFRRILAAAGIQTIRLYDLRHTAATLAVAAGVSVKVISDMRKFRPLYGRVEAVTTEHLHEAIALLRTELRRFDETIAGLERYALGGRRKRGRPRKTPLGARKLSRRSVSYTRPF